VPPPAGGKLGGRLRPSDGSVLPTRDEASRQDRLGLPLEAPSQGGGEVHRERKHGMACSGWVAVVPDVFLLFGELDALAELLEMVAKSRRMTKSLSQEDRRPRRDIVGSNLSGAAGRSCCQMIARRMRVF
jgi:hypothetical protein